MNPGVKFVLNSRNSKLSNDGSVAATYVSQASCPKTCPFLDEGCYAEIDNTGIHTKKLNKSKVLDPLTLALNEAHAIAKGSFWHGMASRLAGTNHALRLHVVGDSRTVGAVKILVQGLEHWLQFIGPVWTYTHAWRKVKRSHWGRVSVLASCESAYSAKLAMQRGYAAACIVPKHPEDGKAYTVPTDLGDVKFIPCPNQTRGVTCKECKLCMNDQFLKLTRSVIAFEAHGSRKELIKSKLVQIGN